MITSERLITNGVSMIHGRGRSERINRRRAHDDGPAEEPISTVLLATRDDWTRDFSTFVLRAMGYALEVSADGDSAVETVSSTQPGLIIVDQDLDRANCLNICGRLHRCYGPHAAPIIILTDHIAEVDMAIAHSVGVVDLLEKPTYMPDLTERLRALLPSHPKNN
jgi:DNA-binding response OmpR family regulator